MSHAMVNVFVVMWTLANDTEDDDSTPVAKDALVFMVVSVNGLWKVPCAYFFCGWLEWN